MLYKIINIEKNILKKFKQRFKTRWEIVTRRIAFGENGVYTDKKELSKSSHEQFRIGNRRRISRHDEGSKKNCLIFWCMENQVKTIYLQAEMVFIVA